MKLWYVAHPYSGNEYHNYLRALRATILLLDRGFVVFSPIVHSHPLDMYKKREPSFWYAQDLEILEKCDGIILCEGWEDSKGCRLEYSKAVKLKLEIRIYSEIMEEKVL